MCKCCQYCLESCYWHLIEEKFCFDDSIALYEVPEKEEKNNNMFDNMAFYDSVSVIAGRSIVTIDPIPPEEKKPVVQQPRRLRWEEETKNLRNKEYISKSVPEISEIKLENDERSKADDEEKKAILSKSPVDSALPRNSRSDETLDTPKTLTVENLFLEVDTEPRRKSLRERRMSKSLYLKTDMPIIRQQSMPKFYLDTPDESQTMTTSMFRCPSATLGSPVPNTSSGFVYDLYSVVQMERERVQYSDKAPVHKEADRTSRLLQIKEKIKLRRVKSSLGVVTNLPHSHQHI